MTAGGVNGRTTTGPQWKAERRVLREPQLYGGDLRAWLGDAEPDEDDSKDWIIRGLIARSVPGALAGDPKTFKTMIAEDWAIAVASGAEDWCGFEIPPDMRGARVLLMPREDHERTTRIRLWRLARGRGLDPRDLAPSLEVDPTSPLYLDEAALAEKLRVSCANFQLVIIDSFATVHRGDESSSRDMARITGIWRDVALSSGTACLMIHHFNGKGGVADTRGPGHRLRGSSAIFAAIRHVVGVERIPDQDDALALRTEGNLEFQPDPFAIRLARDATDTGKQALRFDVLGDPEALRDPEIDAAIVSAIGEAHEGLTARGLRDRVREAIKVRSTRVDERAAELARKEVIWRDTKRRWQTRRTNGQTEIAHVA